MHFPIIQLSNCPLEKEDYFSMFSVCEDSTIQAWTDYVGDAYSDQERKELIRSSWFKNFWEGIAVVDTEKETITYLDEETIKHTLNAEYHKKIDSIQKTLTEGRMHSAWEFRNEGNQWRDCDSLFFDDYGMTSMRLIEDAHYNAGETFYIGGILDAHF